MDPPVVESSGMEVDSVPAATVAGKSVDDVLSAIAVVDAWYNENQNVRDLLARSAFELAAVRPHHVSTICESLVKAIARGRNDNVPVVIGDRSFANRAEATI